MKQLQQLGLSYYESKAIDILFREKCTLKELSRKANIPPGKVYSVIQSLHKRMFVEVSETRPKQVFVPQAWKIIARLIEQKQREDESLFAELRGMVAEITTPQQNPFFQLGITVEDNKLIQLRTFSEAEREVCQIITIHHKPQMNRPSKTIWEKEIVKAIGRGVIFREIYPVTAVLPLHLKNLPPQKFQVRRLDMDFVRCDVIDQKKVLLKLVHHDPITFGGVIFLEDERFARNLQKVFEQFWEEAIH